MRRYLILGCLLSTMGWAQTTPHPLTVIFKDITRHEDFQLVQLTLQQQGVNPFVMSRARHGYFEYEGSFPGESEKLVNLLKTNVGERFHIEARPMGVRLEVIISPRSSPTP